MRTGKRLSAAIAIGGLLCVPAYAAIEGEVWFPLGPAPIENFFGGGVTGRATAIAVNPQRLDELWIGTAAGGVWHSNDGGRNWTPISDKQPSLAIGAIAVANCTTTGCARIYAGTGENAIRRDTYYGRGLLVLDENGKTPEWELRTGEPYSFSLGSINDVVLDPGTSGSTQRIFVTLSSGNTSSSSQATVTAPETIARRHTGGGYGIYRSDNNGATWVQLTVAGADGAKPTDLKMHPANPAVLYAGFLGVGVFTSTNGGDTWCPLNEGIVLPVGCADPSGLQPDVAGGFDHVEIAIHQAGPETIYITFGHCTDRLLQSCHPSVFRSTDAGSSWTERRRGSTSGTGTACPTVYSRYTHGLTVHPHLPDVVLLGGVRLCRSTNGGSSFVPSDNNLVPGGSPWGPITHLDHREIVIHPLDANRVYNTNDGGFAFSVNGGVDWEPGNNDLQITGFYSLTSSPNTPRVIGGSQDNSGQLWRGFRAWDHVGGGDGGYAIIDLDDPLTVYLGVNSGGLLRSGNGGLTFDELVTPPGSNAGNAAFNAPVVQDREPPHLLFYGANRVFRSSTDASTWSAVSPVLATGVTDEITPRQNVITAIGVHGSHLYVGYYGGQVFTSTVPCADASCWADVSAGLPHAPVTDIAVDPNDSDIAYLAFSGFSAEAHVWKTSNAGGTWTAAATGLPAGVPVNALAIEQSATTTIWAGLDSGPDADRSNVYRSSNSGGIWAPRSGGLPNSPVHDLSIDDARGRIYVGMHGRGAYVLGAASVGTFAGWVDGQLRDVPIYGTNFPANQNCTIRLLQRTGDECASGSIDSIGATVRTNPSGTLVARNGAQWDDKSAVWACLNGNCIGGTPIEQCTDDENGDGVDDPLSTVVVDCGGTPGIAAIEGSPNLTNPPGSLIDIGFFEVTGKAGRGRTVNVAPRRVTTSGATQFRLSANLRSRRGGRTLCSVLVAAEAGDNPKNIMTNTRNAINSDNDCKDAGIVAKLDDGLKPDGEDRFRRDPRLLLSGPRLVGDQIVAGVHVTPGDAAAGTCLAIRGLGIAMLSQLRPMRTTFSTLPEGASGGFLTYIEKTALGTCAVTIETRKGQSAGEIVQAFEKTILNTNNDDDKPYCREEENSRSVVRDGDSIVSAFASDLQICLQDSAVGFDLVPE